MVRPDGNVVTKNQRTNVQGKQSRVNRVPKETESGRMISITSFSIRLGRTGGLETVLCALKQGNIGIRVLQETKLTRGIHT